MSDNANAHIHFRVSHADKARLEKLTKLAEYKTLSAYLLSKGLQANLGIKVSREDYDKLTLLAEAQDMLPTAYCLSLALKVWGEKEQIAKLHDIPVETVIRAGPMLIIE